MSYEDERLMLARTLQAEAGNQGYQGMIATGSVINNRSRKAGKPLRDIIMADGQFSAWNSVTGYANGEQGQNMEFEPNSQAMAAADAILSGEAEDPTGGATHYYNPGISDPNWGQRGGGEWTPIGDHVFGQAGGFNSTASARAPQGGLSYGGTISAQAPQAALGDDQGQGLNEPEEPTWKEKMDERMSNSEFGKWKARVDDKIADFTGRKPDKDADARDKRLANAQMLMQNGQRLMNKGFF